MAATRAHPSPCVLANFCVDDPTVHVHPRALWAAKPEVPRGAPRQRRVLSLRQLAEAYNAHATVYYRKNGRSTREAGASGGGPGGRGGNVRGRAGRGPGPAAVPTSARRDGRQRLVAAVHQQAVRPDHARLFRGASLATGDRRPSAAHCGKWRASRKVGRRRRRPKTWNRSRTAWSRPPCRFSVLWSRTWCGYSWRPAPDRVKSAPAALRRGSHRRRLVYRPAEHKTEHQDKDRVIFIGPQGSSDSAAVLAAPQPIIVSHPPTQFASCANGARPTGRRPCRAATPRAVTGSPC